jgi:hypothetical protein
MQTVYLVRGKYDGGKSDGIAKQLTNDGVTFTSLTYGVDQFPWTSVSAIPSVVIDVDGQIAQAIEDREEKPYDHQVTLAAIKAIPVDSPVPVAVITVSDDKGNPETKFQVNQPVTIDVEIQDRKGQVDAAFNGKFIVNIIGPDGPLPIGFDFTNGVSQRTLLLPTPGTYAVSRATSKLADVPETSITVYL